MIKPENQRDICKIHVKRQFFAAGGPQCDFFEKIVFYIVQGSKCRQYRKSPVGRQPGSTVRGIE